jgi:peptidoglycan/LPS O-acetylase OafA/YrhL
LHPAPNILSALQLGRAVAALMVVVYHAAHTAGHFVGALPPFLAVPLSYGYLGVDFFFVLSGFIIFYTNEGKAPDRHWFRRYAESRIVRIYVPYLPIGIGLAAAYTLLPALSAANREWGWVPTLTLMPSSAQPALLVAWTLQHELIFYAVFWLCFLAGRPLVGVGLWAAAILAWNAFGATGPVISNYFFALINVEFFFGMMAVKAIDSRVPNLTFWAGAVIAFGLYLAAGADEWDRVLFGLAMAQLLVLVVRAERSGIVRVPAFGVLLGNASYAIYLVHLPLIALLARFAPPHWLAALLWFSFAGAAAGLIYYLVYERRAIALVRGGLARIGNWPAPGGTAAEVKGGAAPGDGT